MNVVSSSIPGRLRLRHAALRNPARIGRLEANISGWPHMRSVVANARTGGLLVLYDSDALDEADCIRRCEAAVQEVLPVSDVPEPAARQRAKTHRGTPRVRANRLAKRGMLASLTISLLLAAAGSRRWHALAGILFMHGLAVHLWVHRRRLVN